MFHTTFYNTDDYYKKHLCNKLEHFYHSDRQFFNGLILTVNSIITHFTTEMITVKNIFVISHSVCPMQPDIATLVSKFHSKQ